MTGAILAGLLAGVGLVLLATGWRPAPPALGTALNRLHGMALRRPAPCSAGAGTVTLSGRLGQALASTAATDGLAQRRGADLAITRTTPGDLAARCLLAGAAGFVTPAVAGSVLVLVGAGGLAGLAFWFSLLSGAVSFGWPLISLRRRAAARRRTMRHALGAFADVVSIALAGGAGVESALHHGADAGGGWAFGELRAALDSAAVSGLSPWTALTRAGEELGVPELVELAASAALAGDEGARVRASLSARAKALRLRVMSEIETAANSASELMAVPVVVLMLGFVLFVGYPAVVRVLQGL